MKVEPEIITDRLPTEADGKYVLRWDRERWAWNYASSIDHGDIWMRQPPPPKPPVDTSLAASIERMENTKFGGCGTGKQECACASCDQKRLMEAARKWDEHCRNHKGPSFTHPEAMAAKSAMVRTAKQILAGLSNDPDGVWKNGVQQVRDKQTGKWRPITKADFDAPVGESIHVASEQYHDLDPDGVGEGWRLLKVGEVVAHGDEVEKWDKSGWDDSVSFGWRHKEEDRRRRRRIEAEK